MSLNTSNHPLQVRSAVHGQLTLPTRKGGRGSCFRQVILGVPVTNGDKRGKAETKGKIQNIKDLEQNCFCHDTLPMGPASEDSDQASCCPESGAPQLMASWPPAFSTAQQIIITFASLGTVAVPSQSGNHHG